MSVAVSGRSGAVGKIEAKSREYRALMLGLFLVAITIPCEVASTQGILPQIAQGLGVSAGDSQLTLLAVSAGLALGLVPASLLSERHGRRNIVVASVALAAVVAALMPFGQTLVGLVALRVVQGILLSGAAATVVAYVGEELEPDAVAPAMGVYVAGMMLGMILGQVLPAWVVAGTGSWQWALGALAAFVAVCAAAIAVLLPRSKFFTPSALSYAGEARLFLSHLANWQLLVIYLLVFCFMGATASISSGLPFRLESPPYNLSPRAYSSLSLVVLFGVVSAWVAGMAAGKVGLRRTLLGSVVVTLAGVPLLFSSELWAMLLGTAVIVAGGTADTVCLTGLIAKVAVKGKAQATALFSASNSGGSAVAGFLGSRVFVHAGWGGLVVYVGVLCAAGFALALAVRDKAD
ncbi:MAG: MFS transporter [Segniliparus sp.]|uniref:MFS transporter n=1 Tax=Segniliparus sp. TaxID=2804064 RepID=UPI003F34715F